MGSIVLTAVVFLLLYVGSYVTYRETHLFGTGPPPPATAPLALLGSRAVCFDRRTVSGATAYYLFQPLTGLDMMLTGTIFLYYDP